MPHAARGAGVWRCNCPGDTTELEEVPFPFKCKSQPWGCRTGVRQTLGVQRTLGVRQTWGVRWAQEHSRLGTVGQTGVWRRSVPPARPWLALWEGSWRLWTKGLPQTRPAAAVKGPETRGCLASVSGGTGVPRRGLCPALAEGSWGRSALARVAIILFSAALGKTLKAEARPAAACQALALLHTAMLQRRRRDSAA